MAGGGGQLGGGHKPKRGKSKRKHKKRVGFSLDMTPLVDITFLLLTFFMFTTTMAQPQVMDMSLPPELDVEVQVKMSQLFTLLVDDKGQIYWFPGDDPSEPVKLKDLRKLCVEQNLKPAARNELITSLKFSEKADYGLLVQVLDELNLAEIDIVADISDEMDETGEALKRKRKFALTKFGPADIEKLTEDGHLKQETETSVEG